MSGRDTTYSGGAALAQLEQFSRRTGLPSTYVLDKLISWADAQSALVRHAMLGEQSAAGLAELRTLLLKRLASGAKR